MNRYAKVAVSVLMLIAVRSLSAAKAPGAWKQIFDGKDLKGWGHVGPGSFVVTDGILKTEGGMGLL
jgi:hypothetical protein